MSTFMFFSVVLWWCQVTLSQRLLPNRISIGFIYCETEELLRAEEVVSLLNKEPSHKPIIIDLKSHRLSAADNTLTMSLTFCDKLMGNQPLYGVLIARTDCIKVNSSFVCIISSFKGFLGIDSGKS